MISLTKYIAINEALDTDNLEYKVDVWFHNNPGQKEAWDSIVNQMKESHGTMSREAIDNYFSQFECVKSFIDYLTDNISGLEVSDYSEVFRTVIKYVSTL